MLYSSRSHGNLLVAFLRFKLQRSSLCDTIIFCSLVRGVFSSTFVLSFSTHTHMSRKSLLQRFRRLDAYAKPLDDIRIRTASGAYGTDGNLHGPRIHTHSHTLDNHSVIDERHHYFYSILIRSIALYDTRDATRDCSR